MNSYRPARWVRPFAMAALLAGGFYAQPAGAVTAAEMQDLPADHWAFKAIQQLTERYGVMEGFPDRTFRGSKTVTRYELAAALTRVMQKMDEMGTRAQGTPLARPATDAADKNTVVRLKAEFKKELDELDARVKKNEDALAALQEKLGKIVTVKGSVQTLLGDETLDIGKDRTAPYVASSLTVGFKGNVSESTTFDSTIAGTIKAAGSGDVPAVMSGALGKTPTVDTVSVKAARFTTKVGSSTINVGRFPLWLVDFGPYTSQSFKTGDFAVGVGATSPDVASLRTGSDVGASISTELGPLTLQGGLNSNIFIGQLGATFGPVGLKMGYETDHKAITQSLLNTGQRVKTTDNAAVVLDLGGEGAVGATLQANVTNFALTGYGGGLRGGLAGLEANLVAVINSDPGKSVEVASFCGLIAVPTYTLPFGGIKTPSLVFAATDNYTISAPARADNKPTTGAGGQALGKNAGVSVQLGIENPLIPNLIAEYNVQAKLIESIFSANANDPITSEALLLKSVVKF